MIKSPVYDELAQAAAFSLSSISRIFMANCSSVKGFCRKRLRKSCFCQPSSRDVRRKDSEFGWGMVPCGVLPPYRIRRYLRPSLFLLAIATYRYCLRHGDWKKHCLCSVVAMCGQSTGSSRNFALIGAAGRRLPKLLSRPAFAVSSCGAWLAKSGPYSFFLTQAEHVRPDFTSPMKNEVVSSEPRKAETDFGNQFFAVQRLRRTKNANCARLSPLFVASSGIRFPSPTPSFQTLTNTTIR